MEVLLIYLGSSIGSFAVSKLFVKYIDKEIKNRGYEYVNKPKNKFGGILDAIAVCSFFLIPGINVIFSTYLLWNKEKMCDGLIKYQIKEGKIIKMEDENIIEEINNSEFYENNAPKVVVYKVENENRVEMTKEEKIEFLKEEYSRLTGEDLTTKKNVPKQKFKRRIK